MAEELLRAGHRGGLQAMEQALAHQRGGMDRFGKSECSALHVAVWHNKVPLVERLLEEGASPDVQDGESGWSSLHRALYWGHMQAAALLLESGAQLGLVDFKSQTPLDLLSVKLKEYLTTATAVGDVYTWGNGANYQLGSGAVGLQLMPARLEALHGLSVRAVVAAKFHTAAITEDGQLFTWGFGRGGRLGHGDFHIHSGESAVILPQRTAFFSRRRVVSVAAAKHHTAAITSAGELFTWGSNRDGRLGYQAVDTQPTPRKITTLNRQKVAAVAVANRHTVALLEGGTVYSWGSNLQGQLGYGTSDSASNAVPRIVEAMKGKRIKAVATAKRHTVVLTVEGDIYTWGHRVVTPKRVLLSGSRDVARASAAPSGGGWEVVFHKGQSEVARPIAVMIAAGAAHSSAVTQDGVVLAWRSMDPVLRPQEVGGPLAGKTVVAISAGKYRTAAVTSEGDIYMWEGWSKAAEAVPKRGRNLLMPGTSPPELLPPEWEVPKGLKQRNPGKAGALAFQLITPQRVEGLKRVTSVAVGEKHSVALQSWASAPAFYEPPAACGAATQTGEAAGQLSPRGSEASTLEDSDVLPAADGIAAEEGVASDAYWNELEIAIRAAGSAPHTPERPRRRPSSARQEGPASLQRCCERCVAVTMVEPRTTLQILEYADAAGAQALRQHCMRVALSNLDLVLLESRSQFEQLLPHILEDMERQWTARFRQAVTAPASDRSEVSSPTAKPLDRTPSSSVLQASASERSFRNPGEEAQAAEYARQERTIQKKLQQIDALQRRAADEPLDSQQLAKLALRPALTAALQALQHNVPLEEVRRMLASTQSPAASLPKPVASPAESIGGVTGGHSSERRPARRRSRSGSNPASVGTSPTLAGPLHSPQEQHGASSWGSSASQSQKSSATRFRATPARLSMDSALPESVPRVAGFQRQSNGGASSPVWRGPSPQQGFAEPSLSPKVRAQGGSASFLATLHESSMVGDAADGTEGEPQPDAGRPSGDGSEPSTKTPSSSGKKPARRKGGLSMFLSGQLEPQEPKAATPPPVAPRPSPLTWSLQAPKAATPTSLRDILDQEAAQSTAAAAAASIPKAAARSSPSPSGSRGHRGSSDGGGPWPGRGPPAAKPGVPRPAMQVPCSSDDSLGAIAAGGGITVALGDLVKKSKPIAVVATAPPPEKRGPAWGVSGASPPSGQTRLQDIQAEQEHARESISRSWGTSGASPGSHRVSQILTGSTNWRTQPVSASALPGTSPGASFPAGTSPSGGRRSHIVSSQPQTKWYIKDEQEIVPLRSIQTEESAIKELAALYGAANVRIAKPSRPAKS